MGHIRGITKTTSAWQLTERRESMHLSPAHLPTPVVLYQNNHIVAVYKPPGWLSVPNGSPVEDDEPVLSAAADDSLEGGGGGCLLTWLQQQRLGGGSAGTFLKPLHRLDRPCSGVMLWGKTTKAASRIQTHWHRNGNGDAGRGGGVRKTYLAVVPILPSTTSGNLHTLQSLESYSIPVNHPSCSSIESMSLFSSSLFWMQLKGLMVPTVPRSSSTTRTATTHNPKQRYRFPLHNIPPRGWSVTMEPVIAVHKPKKRHSQTVTDVDSSLQQRSSTPTHPTKGRLCELQWMVLAILQSPRHDHTTRDHKDDKIILNGGDYALLGIQTQHGARHMIRAMLAMAGCPIAGDVRYGGSRNAGTMSALPDRSVALHARSIYLSPQAGDATSNDNDDDDALVGRDVPTKHRRHANANTWWEGLSVLAPIPATWGSYFGLNECQVVTWEHQQSSGGEKIIGIKNARNPIE